MELESGQVAILRRTFSQRDFDRFAVLSGDDNPIHVDAEFAGRTRFGRTVCHGMLLYSTICRALSSELRPGFVQREQDLMFVTPTYTGEEITVRLEVTALHPEDGLADIGTLITRPDGSVACQGRTLVALDHEIAKPHEAKKHEDREGHQTSPVGDASREDVERAAKDKSGGATHKWLALGQAAEMARTFSAAELQEYRDLSGDTNPAFSDAIYARTRGWPALQVPGGLLGGLFSALLGTRLPGRGTNWLKQRLVFPAPCYAEQEVTARVEIVRLRPEKDLVNLCTTCMVPGGQVVCEGEALVLVKDLEHA